MNEPEQAGVATIRSSAATTRSGLPLSLNRAPAADISPWVARVYATNGEPPDNNWLSCGILADTQILRVLKQGKWQADTAYGHAEYGECVLFFGPQTQRMAVAVKGRFRTVGLAFTAGAVSALSGPSAEETLDRIMGYDTIGDERDLLARFRDEESPEQWMDALEDCTRQLIVEAGSHPPDPIIAAFERASFVDPSQTIKSFADRHDLSVRQLERIVRRDCGTTPKQVMRRARVLDMAAELLGVAEREEAEELALRYFDQSHLNRDFLEFFGMTPMRFVRTPQPLMTMTLEARQARRLELTGRLAEGEPRPWE